jgi:hypothetical protein
MNWLPWRLINVLFGASILVALAKVDDVVWSEMKRGVQRLVSQVT